MKEKLSALMDGELDPREVEEVLVSLRQDRTLLQEWASWQAGRDILKGEGVAQAGFVERFSRRLEAEPVVIAPRRIRVLRRLAVPVTVAASVAFVGIAVWQYYGGSIEPVTANQMAAETEAVLHDYLAAHRQSEGNPFVERGVQKAQFQVAGQR
ncbi:sigma-E factor negative regulatory protein RseA [Formivibrio citricus]|uniref:Sigma-E factor negative regulatory protein RseA n=1 Tax=Formivibrio citricus TaxID=83765 RepID=A0A1I4WFA8_9NEIS|nr:sigma-E factor negative regulatory protein [Formivibrio citricus]SFN12461.1 sigma-E factor negative regulatory protein RseA [Formivibrio citricus]